jgi:hypothetical protein
MTDHPNTPLAAAEREILLSRDDPSYHDTPIQRKSMPEDGTGAVLVSVWLEQNFADLKNACEVSVALRARRAFLGRRFRRKDTAQT